MSTTVGTFGTESFRRIIVRIKNQRNLFPYFGSKTQHGTKCNYMHNQQCYTKTFRATESLILYCAFIQGISMMVHSIHSLNTSRIRNDIHVSHLSPRKEKIF
jgi:hypothetical protein